MSLVRWLLSACAACLCCQQVWIGGPAMMIWPIMLRGGANLLPLVACPSPSCSAWIGLAWYVCVYVCETYVSGVGLLGASLVRHGLQPLCMACILTLQASPVVPCPCCDFFGWHLGCCWCDWPKCRMAANDMA